MIHTYFAKLTGIALVVISLITHAQDSKPLE